MTKVLRFSKTLISLGIYGIPHLFNERSKIRFSPSILKDINLFLVILSKSLITSISS